MWFVYLPVVNFMIDKIDLGLGFSGIGLSLIAIILLYL